MLLDKYTENIDGMEYVTHIYKNRKDESLCDGFLWAMGGGLSLLTCEGVTLEAFKQKSITAKENFRNGLVFCSECGSLQEYEKIKYNQYFAGVYCKECWDREIKDIEANETYD